jgi:polyisoprenoid-binding protein YceI
MGRLFAKNHFSIITFIRASLLASGMALMATGPAVAAEETVSYTLTRQYGSVLFRVMQQQYLNLVGRFDQYAGTLVMDFDDLSNSRLTASVNMGSLSMADGDVVETLVNSSVWFNAPLFPEATFTTTSVDVTGDMTADFHGELTFVGVKKPWTLHVQFYPGSDGELTGSSIGMLATASFNRTDFGLNQYMNMADDPVSIEVNVKFNRD